MLLHWHLERPKPEAVLVAILKTWLIYSVAIWLAAAILPGFKVKGLGGAMVVALVLGLLNAVIGGILFLAIGIGTLGLGFLLDFATRWLVMAILLVATDKLSTNLKIKNFGTSILGAMLISGVVAVANLLTK